MSTFSPNPSTETRADGDHNERNGGDRNSKFLRRHLTWIKFAPALLVWPIWIYIMLQHNLWKSVFSTYWPMTLAMIAGSFVAGSTPLGGGVVAFPVAVLVLQFTPMEARDISLLVQSVGMNAAAYLLCLTKRHFLDLELILGFTFSGVLGLLIGFLVHPNSGIINTIYTVLIFEFGIVFFYTYCINPAKKSAVATFATEACPEENSNNLSWRLVAARVFMVMFGLAGGIVTSVIGSGSDISLFIFGLYLWNIVFPTQQLCENTLTASSVVVMGILSFVGAVLRLLDDGFNATTIYTWAAMIPVVVIGTYKALSFDEVSLFF